VDFDDLEEAGAITGERKGATGIAGLIVLFLVSTIVTML
jgi:hypothetical protein